jgi:hypothetical protein
MLKRRPIMKPTPATLNEVLLTAVETAELLGFAVYCLPRKPPTIVFRLRDAAQPDGYRYLAPGGEYLVGNRSPVELNQVMRRVAETHRVGVLCTGIADGGTQYTTFYFERSKDFLEYQRGYRKYFTEPESLFTYYRVDPATRYPDHEVADDNPIFFTAPAPAPTSRAWRGWVGEGAGLGEANGKRKEPKAPRERVAAKTKSSPQPTAASPPPLAFKPGLRAMRRLR